MKKYDNYSFFDKPVPYKKLLIHPVTVYDWILLMIYSQVLTLEKNSVPDVKVISMSYLDYIFYSSDDENQNILKLHGLLCLSLKRELEVGKDVFYRQEKNGKWIIIIDGEIYNGQDFDELKNIIAEINNVELPDETIQKEIRDRMALAKRMKMKESNSTPANIEELIVAVLISTGMNINDVYALTVRKFLKVLDRADAKLHYEIYLGASMSGMVEFKDKSFIKHWLSSLEKSGVDGLVALENLERKMSS